AGDIGPDAAATTVLLRSADADGPTLHRVELPHVIPLGLGVDDVVDPVLPRDHGVIEVVVPGRLSVQVETAEPGIVDLVQDRVDGIVVALRHPANAEHATWDGTLVPGGHVVALLSARLN